MNSETNHPGHCPACGRTNLPAARFCEECGARLAAAPETESEHMVRLPGVTEAEPAVAAVPPETARDLSRPDATRRTVGARGEPPLPPSPVPTSRVETAPVGRGPITPPDARSHETPVGASAPKRETSPTPAPTAGGTATTTPPRSLLTVGFALLLGAIALLVAGRQVGATETLTIFSFCLGPVGLIALVIGFVRLLVVRRL